MTIFDLVKEKTGINIKDLSSKENDLFYENLLIIYSDPTKFVARGEEKEHLQNIKDIVKPVKMMRLQTNIKIFNEFRDYCNALYPDKPFYEYLVGTRKLPTSKVLAFKLFFVIDYHAVNNHMKKEFDLPDLQRSGLYSENGNLIFYKHRLIIPYISNGEMIYLRGRYFDEKNNTKPEPGNSKYIGLSNDSLNLNQTKRFFNSQILKRMFKGERLLIVEGELDAIAGEALGFNTIGIPGAQNIPDINQFKKLLPYEIILCGDNDNAGNEMINRVTQIFMDMKKEITIKQLNKKDLNEFLAA